VQKKKLANALRIVPREVTSTHSLPHIKRASKHVKQKKTRRDPQSTMKYVYNILASGEN
jgi:hypothetical protein